MGLETTNPVVVHAFIRSKTDQYERVCQPHLGGKVQLVRSGEAGTQFAMGVQLGKVYETVIFAQLPSVLMKVTGSPKNPVRRPASNDEKPPEKQEIELNDEKMLEILAAWADGKSATTVRGLVGVFQNGKLAK